MKTLDILKYVFTLVGAGMLVGAVMSYSSKVSFGICVLRAFGSGECQNQQFLFPLGTAHDSRWPVAI